MRMNTTREASAIDDGSKEETNDGGALGDVLDVLADEVKDEEDTIGTATTNRSNDVLDATYGSENYEDSIVDRLPSKNGDGEEKYEVRYAPDGGYDEYGYRVRDTNTAVSSPSSSFSSSDNKDFIDGNWGYTGDWDDDGWGGSASTPSKSSSKSSTEVSASSEDLWSAPNASGHSGDTSGSNLSSKSSKCTGKSGKSTSSPNHWNSPDSYWSASSSSDWSSSSSSGSGKAGKSGGSGSSGSGKSGKSGGSGSPSGSGKSGKSGGSGSSGSGK